MASIPVMSLPDSRHRLALNLRVWGAEYQCLRCDHGWTDWTGPTECPECGHLYVGWTNYEGMCADRFRGREPSEE